MLQIIIAFITLVVILYDCNGFVVQPRRRFPAFFAETGTSETTHDVTQSTTEATTAEGGCYATTVFKCNTVRSTPEKIFNKLTNCRVTWNKWISPGSLIKSDHDILKIKGDRFTEFFGPGSSSMITWEVQHLAMDSGESQLQLSSSAKVGTFGWDKIDMNFRMSQQIEVDDTVTTTLVFSYGWLVMNSWVSAIEKAFMRSSMVADNEKAFRRLIALCEEGP